VRIVKGKGLKHTQMSIVREVFTQYCQNYNFLLRIKLQNGAGDEITYLLRIDEPQVHVSIWRPFNLTRLIHSFPQFFSESTEIVHQMTP
jgi:hypothetical protein